MGASLAGLMTALAIARQGLRVTVLERSDDSGRTGAALSVPNGLLERITGLPSDRLPHALASGVQKTLSRWSKSIAARLVWGRILGHTAETFTFRRRRRSR